MENIISVKNLRKEFKVYRRKPGLMGSLRTLFSMRHDIVKAVDGITFDVREGEIIGFIGSNGAGKSTTIKMLSGILYPTSGDLSVLGRVPYQQRKKNAAQIGVVFGQRTQLLWDLPLGESFTLLRWIYGIEKDAFAGKLAELTELLDMGDFMRAPVRSLSLGQKARGELAAALLHDPKVLFLDEPTIGLDVAVRDRILDFINDLNKSQRTTVILTSHDLINMEKFCERIIIIDKGRLIFDGPRSRLKDIFGPTRDILVHYEQHIDGVQFGPGFNVIAKDTHSVHLEIDLARVSFSDVLAQLGRYGTIADISISSPTVESVVKKILLQP